MMSKDGESSVLELELKQRFERPVRPLHLSDPERDPFLLTPTGEMDPATVVKPFWQRDWSDYLWMVLLILFLLNIAYLTWPRTTDTLVITPHPAALAVNLQNQPVLVEDSRVPSRSPEYWWVQPETKAGRQTFTVRDRVSSRKPQKSIAGKGLVGQIHLNTATASQLQQLPGIGPKLAQEILQYRKAHGGFTQVQQLLDVPGIGPKKFAKLAPFCVL